MADEKLRQFALATLTIYTSILYNCELADDFPYGYEFDQLYTGVTAICIEENWLRQHLQQNIDAMLIVFILDKEKRQATVGERLLMMQ